MTATGTTHVTATTRMAAATATTGMAAATAATGMATATTTAAVLCERRRASQDRPQNAGRQKKAFALNAHGCHLP
jgi:type IV secretory pathway VirB6-like protein